MIKISFFNRICKHNADILSPRKQLLIYTSCKRTLAFIKNHIFRPSAEQKSNTGSALFCFLSSVFGRHHLHHAVWCRAGRARFGDFLERKHRRHTTNVLGAVGESSHIKIKTFINILKRLARWNITTRTLADTCNDSVLSDIQFGYLAVKYFKCSLVKCVGTWFRKYCLERFNMWRPRVLHLLCWSLITLFVFYVF